MEIKGRGKYEENEFHIRINVTSVFKIHTVSIILINDKVYVIAVQSIIIKMKGMNGLI